MARRVKKENMFRKLLVQLMRDHKLSIRDAALIASVAPSTIAGWRAGRNPDNFEAVRNLAGHFNVTLGYLLTGKSDNKNSGPVYSETLLGPDGSPVEFELAKVLIQPLSMGRK
jgi:transcriptional regulator with XRE-family HTH domain